MMQGKIIFLDVDGTLVNYEGQIPESAVKACVSPERKEIRSISVQAGAGRKYIRRSGRSGWTG